MSCRYLPDWAWLQVLGFFNGECAYCGKSNEPLTADHLVPKSAGGADVPENIVPACPHCNEAKADQDWREFLMNSENFSQSRMNRIFDWRRIARQARVGKKHFFDREEQESTSA